MTTEVIVLDKVTQLESLVSSLQAILNDQTFVMHDLRPQLSDIQVSLKKMQDKQETISNEEIIKQVVAMKALTENIIASSEIKKQLDATKQQLEASSENDKNGKVLQQLSAEEHQFSPPMSILPINTITRTASRQQFNTSRTPSRNPSRNLSRPSSRPSSIPSSRAVSRTVSPAQTPISLSRTSPRNKLDSSNESPLIKPYKVNEFPTINEKSEGDDEDDDECKDTSLDRMISNITSLISEATEAVKLPIKGHEKDRTFSIISTSSIDFDEINRQLDDLDDEEDEDDEEEFEEPIVMDRSLKPEDAEERWPTRKHKRTRTKSDANQEDFLKSLSSFNDSMTGLADLIEGLTTELPEDEGDAQSGIQYRVSTNELLRVGSFC